MPILGGVGEQTVEQAGKEADALESKVSTDAQALVAQIGSIVQSLNDSLTRIAVAFERIAAATEAVAGVVAKGYTIQNTTDVVPK